MMTNDLINLTRGELYLYLIEYQKSEKSQNRPESIREKKNLQEWSITSSHFHSEVSKGIRFRA